MICDCCVTHLEYPELTKKTYSMGCNWCAARYVANGGKEDIANWSRNGVDVRQATQLRLSAEFVNPEIKERRKKTSR